MLVECPKCKSTFRVPEEKGKLSFSKFKCSICNHIWEKNIKIKNPKLPAKKKSEKAFKHILILNFILIIITIIVIVLYKDKLVYIDVYWTELYNFFLNLIPIK
ncbi:MAG: hypothetical protein CFH34_00236 [Alphaproteobacteria bacterium MarineAlpha9_Bin4]|nr:hypothetical protein [Pelagibacterales bacterium]PPR27407.1 MAG: hypothetical protein CFH34_00236 [Alphaproteobacteria bacterium MarineAlpha9_Bin4]|tara:strand:- start:282 stop:590 length:309 start_codon:yes stop_codon:yes gene_type:complete